MDAAIEVVDRNDVDMYKGEMKAAKAAEENMETFKFEFAKCRSDLDEKMPPQKKKDCCQDSDTRQSHVPARGQSLHSSRCIHMDIKWEARVVGAHASIQESFRLYGGKDDEGRAINHCIKQLWYQYLEMRGMPHSQCPFDGI